MHCTVRRRRQVVLILLNKPYHVLCQFRDPDGRPVLKDYIDTPDVYAAGRLDFDSEGLVCLTDDGRLQAKISQPKSNIKKRYWAQVEGSPSDAQLEELVSGVKLKDGVAKAIAATLIDPSDTLWARDPPIRVRAKIPDTWIEITLSQGRNRQVRRMTAAVGLPTLRLIRFSVGPWTLDGLAPGETREISNADAWKSLS